MPDSVRSALKKLIGEPVHEAIDRIHVLEYSPFARLHGRAKATTRPRRIYLRGSGADFFSDPELMLHEYCHVLLQWETGALTLRRYMREWLRHGYWNNRYEVEARTFAHHHLLQFRALLPAAVTRNRQRDAS